MEYFNSGNTLITDGRLVVHGTNYPLENINSFKILDHYDERNDWKKLFRRWIFSILLAAVALIAIIFFVKDDPLMTLSVAELVKLAAKFFPILAVAILIVLLIFPPKETYHIGKYSLSLTTSNGSSSVLTTDNREWILNLQTSLNTAIDARSGRQ